MNPVGGNLPCALAGEAALVVGALLVLGIDLTLTRNRSLESRWRTASVLGIAAVVVALGLVLRVGAAGPMAGDALTLDEFGAGVRLGVLALAGLTLLVSVGTMRLRNPAEYVAILLFATTGFTLMAVTQQLLLGFIAIELASLSLYVLAGFDKTRPYSAEAGLKYFLLGGISAAFLLFGFSLLYGLTGSIELPKIAETLAQQGLSPLLLVAFAMIAVAFGFKAAAAPFHLWAPDVYQGAPVSSAALIASASKLAGFAFFARLLWSGLDTAVSQHASPGWMPVLAVISAASLLLGNFAALAQTSLRRLLAYSAIAHAGALALGVMAVGKAGPAPLFYYATTYGLATVGAFGVVAVLENAGVGPLITDLAGLHKRSPLLAYCLMIFVLSLAGIPPLAGFFGKFAVFAAALEMNGLAGPAGWLAFAAIMLSAVALYYYLIVLKNALVAPPAAGADSRLPVPASAAVALLIAALLLVVLGVAPSLLLSVVA